MKNPDCSQRDDVVEAIGAVRRRQGRVLGLVLGTFVLSCMAGCSAGEETILPDDIVSSDEDLINGTYEGRSLPSKTLSLTFDDGPASRTLELSAYLRDQGIAATFFVNGHCFYTDQCSKKAPIEADVILPKLEADGHLIGNHTETHKSLTSSSISAKAIFQELKKTDDAISPYVDQGHFLFRAPFGDYNKKVYNALKSTAMKKYVGQVGWAMGGDENVAADWACWDKGLTTRDCGNRYLADIHSQKQGIVLFHDADYGNSTNHDVARGKGNTVDMVKYLVPLLKAKGYKFVRADQIAEIKEKLPK